MDSSLTRTNSVPCERFVITEHYAVRVHEARSVGSTLLSVNANVSYQGRTQQERKVNTNYWAVTTSRCGPIARGQQVII